MKEDRAWAAVLLCDPCVYCGGPPDGLDHIVAESVGGSNRADNRAPACHKCDVVKGAAPLWLFLLARQQAVCRAARRTRYRSDARRNTAVCAMTPPLLRALTAL